MSVPALPTTLYDEIIELLITAPTPQQIMDFQFSDTLQERFEDLLHFNRTNQLTDADHDEAQIFLQMDHLMSLRKIRAFSELE